MLLGSGELAAGATTLALFGDVATEITIRHDGDEGLFRADESIEFLAPVYAGDYIEATGKLIKVGNIIVKKMPIVNIQTLPFLC